MYDWQHKGQNVKYNQVREQTEMYGQADKKIFLYILIQPSALPLHPYDECVRCCPKVGPSGT